MLYQADLKANRTAVPDLLTFEQSLKNHHNSPRALSKVAQQRDEAYYQIEAPMHICQMAMEPEYECKHPHS